MRIISYFERNPKANPTVMTTATMFDFFTKLVNAHYLADKSDASIMRVARTPGKQALMDIKTDWATIMRCMPGMQSIISVSSTPSQKG